MSKAVVINRFGGPEVLEVVDIERPSPPPGGVVVEVRAAGVNPVEGKVRAGRRASGPLTAPLRLGSDAAGVVVAVASDTTGFAVGDEVVARGLAGAYATHVAARPEQLAPSLPASRSRRAPGSASPPVPRTSRCVRSR